MAKKSSKKSTKSSTVTGIFSQFVPQQPVCTAPAAAATEPAPVASQCALSVESIEGVLAATKAYGSTAPAARHDIALGIARVLGVKLRGAPVAADPAKYGTWAEFCAKKLGSASPAQAQNVAQPETLVPLPQMGSNAMVLEHRAKSALIAAFEKDEKCPNGEVRVRGLYLDKAGTWKLAAGRGYNVSVERIADLGRLVQIATSA